MQKKGNIAFQGKPPKNLPKMKLGEAKDSKSAEKHLISREIRCFMAYLPLMDTMHHALTAWCIFYWFHFDSQGRWGQKGQNAECSPRSLLSAVPEAFCRQIISGMFLVNVQKQRAKNARVRF